jgi:hypothetical protein
MADHNDYADPDLPPPRRWLIAVAVYLAFGLGFITLGLAFLLFIRLTVKN